MNFRRVIEMSEPQKILIEFDGTVMIAKKSDNKWKCVVTDKDGEGSIRTMRSNFVDAFEWCFENAKAELAFNEIKDRMQERDYEDIDPEDYTK